MGFYQNWIRHFAPLKFRDLQVATRSTVLPEALDITLKCHKDRQDRAGC